ncbi:MAG: hypothetical protein IKN31_04680 [Bacteroidales bacterium]|nr:hypothetical protein [Bacteroidales bacterium]
MRTTFISPVMGEAELALGAFFTRYSLRCPITESKKDYTLYHDLSVGVYF